MSIYKFQDALTALTVPPATTDSFLQYSTVAVNTAQVPATLLAAAPQSVTALTSLSTGTNINPWGITTIKSSNNSLGYLLSAPTSPGLSVKISMLSTSAATVTSCGATIVTNGSTTLTVMTFNGVFAYADLTSLTTSSWRNLTSTTTANIAWS